MSLKTAWQETCKFIKMMQKSEPHLLVYLFLTAMMTATVPFIPIYFSAQILDQLIAGQFHSAMQNVYWMIGISGVLGITSKALNQRFLKIQDCSENKISHRIVEKAYQLEYEELEKTETLDEMRTLCSRALRAWGAEMQSVVAAEELSELQKELCKSVRGEDNADAIAEEIADVQIMLEQMLLLHDCRDAVDEWRRRKLERLEQRLPKIADRSQYNHAWVLERTDGSTRYYYCEKCGARHKQAVPQKADAAWE